MLLLPLAATVHATEPAVGAPVRLDEAHVAELMRNDAGGTLVVNFFASWCGPCQKELPAVERHVLAHPGVRGLHVSLDEPRDAARVQTFQTTFGLRLPMVHLDAGAPGPAVGRLVKDWPDKIPVTLVLGPGGVERARFVGLVDLARLDAVLTEAPVAPAGAVAP